MSGLSLHETVVGGRKPISVFRFGSSVLARPADFRSVADVVRAEVSANCKVLAARCLQPARKLPWHYSCWR